MPYKDLAKRREKAREYSARHYAANTEKHKAATKEVRKKAREKWNAYKANLVCSQCGAMHPAIIDFHHPPGTKEYSVHMLAQDGRYKKAYKEIEKCVILCSNCHRIHHYDERQEKKKGELGSPSSG